MKEKLLKLYKVQEKILRPINFHKKSPGKGFGIYQTKDKFNLPTTDLIRFGDMKLIDAIEEIIQ